ncbi:MAG: phospholipase A [Candidatus Omnitrophica bacterium]|nr:phospholipase A [Candidatus Omnitrophota bacterium]
MFRFKINLSSIKFTLFIFMFLIVSTQVAAQENVKEEASYPQDLAQDDSFETLFALYQPYLENIGAYNPIYFLIGSNPKKSKFQFSFKYKFYNPENDFDHYRNLSEGIFFAYTQTSFWDLKSDSKPFEDTSYKPEMFFMSSNLYSGANKFTQFFFSTGLQHESNGKSEMNSRSTNFIYFEPNLICYDKDTSLGLQIFPRIWTYFENDNQTNEDLKDYRGYFDLGVRVGKAEKLVVESHLRAARRGNSWELNFTYPMNIKNFELYLQVQYSNALAESLLNYKERREALRIGFAVMR